MSYIKKLFDKFGVVEQVIEKLCIPHGVGVACKWFLPILVLAIYTGSCTDFVQIEPPGSDLVKETVFKNDETAVDAIDAIYHKMAATGFASGFRNSVTKLASLSADGLAEYSSNILAGAFYINNILPSNSYNSVLWSSAYNRIYMANAVIEGVEENEEISPGVATQLEGEAKFIRAFCHFYLANLYGDVPLITTTDYQVNIVAGRVPVEDVYKQIVLDLQDALELLEEDYSASEEERIRPNKRAAAALLARVYLYTQDWENAEAMATEVIEDNQYRLLPDLNQVFLANSEEAIWQLFPIRTGRNTHEGYDFILTPTSILRAALTSEFINAFEAGDDRMTNWVGSFNDGTDTWYYPYKYKIKTGDVLTEYSMVLRLAEQYLIRAEARARQGGDLTDAIADVDAIRERANLPLIADTNPAISQADLLLAIEQERKMELFTEWGHRWLDLKRWGKADMALSPLKSEWNATDVLYPIPEDDVLRNPNLSQNTGY